MTSTRTLSSHRVALVLLASVLIFTNSSCFSNLIRVPIKEIKDTSGRLLKEPFDRIESSGVYDLKEIVRIAKLRASSACGGSTKVSILEELGRLLRSCGSRGGPVLY
jgi:hypothetical protein